MKLVRVRMPLPSNDHATLPLDGVLGFDAKRHKDRMSLALKSLIRISFIGESKNYIISQVAACDGVESKLEQFSFAVWFNEIPCCI